MRRVHTAESTIEIAHLRNVLESEGIACIVRNDRLAGVIGEIPFVECWPELWIAEPGQELRARGLIEQALRPRPAGKPWVCAECGEHIDAAFTECWRCAVADDAEGTDA
jgi:Putative prokaryotic signal transducing protein